MRLSIFSELSMKYSIILSFLCINFLLFGFKIALIIHLFRDYIKPPNIHQNSVTYFA